MELLLLLLLFLVVGFFPPTFILLVDHVVLYNMLEGACIRIMFTGWISYLLVAWGLFGFPLVCQKDFQIVWRRVRRVRRRRNKSFETSSRCLFSIVPFYQCIKQHIVSLFVIFTFCVTMLRVGSTQTVSSKLHPNQWNFCLNQISKKFN